MSDMDEDVDHMIEMDQENMEEQRQQAGAEEASAAQPAYGFSFLADTSQGQAVHKRARTEKEGNTGTQGSGGGEEGEEDDEQEECIGQSYEDEEDDDDQEEWSGNKSGKKQLSEEEVERRYTHPRNVNNLSRSFKIVNIEDVMNIFGNDGYIYTFLSRADGPMLSPMAVNHIMMIQNVINSNIYSDHVFATENLEPIFNSSDKTLHKLMETIEVRDHPYTEDPHTYVDELSKRMDRMDTDIIKDFRQDSEKMKKIKRSVPVGANLVAPVCASFEEDGEELIMGFWLVMFKSKKNYDFGGHMMSKMGGSTVDFKCPNNKKMTPEQGDALQKVIYESLLKEYENSENCTNFLDHENAVEINPGTRIDERCAPDSLEAVTNLHSKYLDIIHTIKKGEGPFTDQYHLPTPN